MDETRKYDLMELMELRRTAKNSYWRDQYDGIINKIMRETPEMRKYRDELVDAIRGGDRRHVRFVQERLKKLKMDQTGGKEL